MLTLYNPTGAGAITLTLYNTDGVKAYVNGLTAAPSAVTAGTAQVFVSVFTSATQTRWVRLYNAIG